MTRAEAALVDEIATRLRTREDGGGPVLETVLPAFRRLFHANRSGSYDLVTGDAGLSTGFMHAQGYGGHGYKDDFDAMLRRRPVGWGTFDPFRPDSRICNRAGIVRISFVDRQREQNPDLARVIARHPWLGDDEQLRILVCEGGSFVAWFGVMRRDSFTEQERRTMQRFARPLHERLVLERQLAFAPLGFQAMGAALEAVGAPAFLFRPPASFAYANSAGRLLLDSERASTLDALNASSIGRAGAYALSRLSSRGAPALFLAIRRRRVDTGPRAVAVARRWSLTRRQGDVLARVASGAANKAIAQDLHCSESAVEMHVTSLLARTGAKSRSELVARFWMEQG